MDNCGFSNLTCTDNLARLSSAAKGVFMTAQKNRVYNTQCKREARSTLRSNACARVTLSFYRYVDIPEPTALRLQLYQSWDKLGILGRVYIAQEGINAQVSVASKQLKQFKAVVEKYFPEMSYREAVEEGAASFAILIVKVRKKIVQDGLSDFKFSPENAGKHLSPEEWNRAMDDPNTLVVDMRNHYESAVGHFANAIRPDCDTFREELPLVKDMLQDKKEKKLLLYCTGGIRCEKASAYLRQEGFKDVNQLNGGIINYAHAVKRKEVPCYYRGKNFVFDDRLGERITEDILTECSQCGTKNDEHTNCANDVCHVLFIQCPDCRKNFSNCCSAECQSFSKLPAEEKKLRGLEFRKQFKSRLRPKIRKYD